MEDEILDHFEEDDTFNSKIIAIKYFYFESKARLYSRWNGLDEDFGTPRVDLVGKEIVRWATDTHALLDQLRDAAISRGTRARADRRRWHLRRRRHHPGRTSTPDDLPVVGLPGRRIPAPQR